MKAHEKLADALEPDVSNVRLNRQWIAVREGTEAATARSRLPGWGLALAAALLLAAAVGIFVTKQMNTSTSEEAPAVAADQDIERDSGVQLADGSTVSPVGNASFAVAVEEEKRVEVALNDGKARFSVTRKKGREFEVRAEDVRVVVVGTRFMVSNQAAAGGTISVSVEEGVVDVYVDGRSNPVARLTAGSRWTTTSLERERMTASADILGSGGARAADASRALLGRAARTPIEIKEKAARVQRESQQDAEPQPGAHRPGASKLFEQGRAARRAGNYRQAAEHFSALLEEYPDNSRAGLAAFQLGRLQADKLGEHRMAVKAFERAIKATNNSAYKEDAMARRVQSYYKLGNRSRCETSRQAYISVYPSGVHASMLPDCSNL